MKNLQVNSQPGISSRQCQLRKETVPSSNSVVKIVTSCLMSVRKLMMEKSSLSGGKGELLCGSKLSGEVLIMS